MRRYVGDGGKWHNSAVKLDVPQTYKEFRERLKNRTLPPGFRWSRGTMDHSAAAEAERTAAVAAVAAERLQAAATRAGQTITDEMGTTTYDADGNAVSVIPSEVANSQEVYTGKEYGFQRADDARALAADERQRQHDAIQKELDVTDAIKYEKDKGLLPGTVDAFNKINSGLISVADFAADVGIVPAGMKELYTTFAPPGSKYYTDGSIASKTIKPITDALTAVLPPELAAAPPSLQAPPPLTPPSNASVAELTDLQVMATEAYSSTPKANVSGWTMVTHTPTLTFYFKSGEVVVAVRGTADATDVQADASIPLNRLTRSVRYLEDAEVLRKFKFAHPNWTTYTAVGHSLGGAIIDGFIKDGLVQSGVSYNPAVQPIDLLANLPNRRIYNEDDPLYKMMGQFAKGVEVRKNPKSQMNTLARMGAVGFAQHKLDAHGLENFRGGQAQY